VNDGPTRLSDCGGWIHGGDDIEREARTPFMSVTQRSSVGPHRHKSAEHVTVLSGTLLVGWGEVWDPTKLKEVRAGEVVEVPGGVVHFSAVREETVMEVKITGRYEIEYVLESDDPRGGKALTMPAAGRQHPFSR
jgi:mannose-6-phosphate isomerase-like protein (cupin superfamily)